MYKLAQRAHFAMPSSSTLEEKKRSNCGTENNMVFFSFTEEQVEWTACCCHSLEAESNGFSLRVSCSSCQMLKGEPRGILPAL